MASDTLKMAQPLADTGEDEQTPQPKIKPVTAPKMPTVPQVNQTTGGTTQPVQQPTPAPQTADPLAFAPLTNPVPTNGSTLTMASTTPYVSPTSAPTPPTQAIQDWVNYSPMTGKTEDEKLAIMLANAKLAPKQPVGGTDYSQFRSTANQTIDANGNVVNTADPAKVAKIEELMKTVGPQAAAEQGAALAKVNDANAAFDTDESKYDFDQQAKSIEALNGIYPDKQKALDNYLRQGFVAPQKDDGTLGDTTTVVPGFGGQTSGGSSGGGSTGVAGGGMADVPRGTDGGVGSTTVPVQTSEINPDDSLLSKVITPGQGLDRTKIFQDSLKSTIENVLDPAMQARMRDLNRYNFGAGRGVSGIARTSQGDVVSDYGRQIADLTNQGMAGALTGNIDDYWRSLDETQQERDYQKGLSDTAFGQDVTRAQLEDALTNSAFGRALSQETAGYANSPESWDAYLSSVFGDQASAALKAAMGAFGNAGQGSANGGGGGGGIGQFWDWLKGQFGGGGGSSGGMRDEQRSIIDDILSKGLPGPQVIPSGA